MTRPTCHIIGAALVAALMPRPGWAQDSTTDPRRVEDAINPPVLERPENGDGAQAISQLAAGQTTVREVVRRVATSPEHVHRFMTGNGASALAAAYRHVLGEEPEALIAQSDNPYTIVNDIIDSPQYQRLYSDDAVPGQSLRYCGPGGATSGSPRFRSLDTNGNGAIEREEWTGSPRAFSALDRNGDGSLSREEVRQGERRAGRLAVEEGVDFDDEGVAGPAAP
jgi:hypothetical protein